MPDPQPLSPPSPELDEEAARTGAPAINDELDQEVEAGLLTREEEEQRMKDVLSGKVGA